VLIIRHLCDHPRVRKDVFDRVPSACLTLSQISSYSKLDPKIAELFILTPGENAPVQPDWANLLVTK
jgi:hypothetical protein